MKINYTKSAIADLVSLPNEVQKRIAQKMRFYEQVQNPIRFAERLTNFKDADYRFRIVSIEFYLILLVILFCE